MGTNYYAIPKEKDVQDIKERVLELIDSGDFSEAADKLVEFTVHIGKKSFGWKFLFDHNDWKYFGKNIKQVMDWLEKYDIKDEYGGLISNDVFWDMVKTSTLDDDMVSSHDDLNIDGFRFSRYTGFS